MEVGVENEAHGAGQEAIPLFVIRMKYLMRK